MLIYDTQLGPFIWRLPDPLSYLSIKLEGGEEENVCVCVMCIVSSYSSNELAMRVDRMQLCGSSVQ